MLAVATERGVMRAEGVLHIDTNALLEEKSVVVVEREGHGDAEELRWVVIEKEGGDEGEKDTEAVGLADSERQNVLNAEADAEAVENEVGVGVCEARALEEGAKVGEPTAVPLRVAEGVACTLIDGVIEALLQSVPVAHAVVDALAIEETDPHALFDNVPVAVPHAPRDTLPEKVPKKDAVTVAVTHATEDGVPLAQVDVVPHAVPVLLMAVEGVKEVRVDGLLKALRHAADEGDTGLVGLCVKVPAPVVHAVADVRAVAHAVADVRAVEHAEGLLAVLPHAVAVGVRLPLNVEEPVAVGLDVAVRVRVREEVPVAVVAEEVDARAVEDPDPLAVLERVPDAEAHAVAVALCVAVADPGAVDDPVLEALPHSLVV
jgi:hypothetical protein